jgi:hypothetical protein
MRGLNVLFRNQGQVIVLRVLYHADSPLTGREVERRTGLSNRGAMHALEGLTDAGIVFCEPAGRANLYTLNTGHYLVQKALRPALDAEDRFWLDLAKTVRRTVKPRPLAAVATGPLTRDETEYGGRLSLTMVFSTGRKRIQSLPSIQRLAEAARERYALILEHQLLDLNTMDRKEYVPLWRRVEREGILLFGTLP